MVSVVISASQSLAFDPKGGHSQHRMNECIVRVYAVVTLTPSTPNYHVKES